MKIFPRLSIWKKTSVLLNHIKQCMVQFSTYFMTGDVTHTDTRTNEETEEMQIIAAMMVEKKVIMTNNKERVLLHYICVPDAFRRMNVATALMTTVFKKNEYHKKEIMAVTALPNRYRHDENYETMVSFSLLLTSKPCQGKNCRMMSTMSTRLY